MRQIQFAVMAVVACVGISAAAQEPPAQSKCPGLSFDETARPWAEPRVIAAPEYQSAWVEAGISGVVDVEVEIGLNSRITRIESIASEPHHPELEGAVKDIIKYWWFYRETDCDCKPVVGSAKLRVWFEIRDGKGVVSVSNRPRPGQPGGESHVLTNRSAIAKHLSVRFPREARRAGRGAEVFAAITLSPYTGKAEKVDIVQVETSYDLKRAFSSVTEEALLMTAFELGTVDAGKPPRVCFTLSFQLRGESAD